MKTPKEYKKLIDAGVVTTEIIASAIYSLNKRAKNCKERNPGEYMKSKKKRNWDLLHVDSEFTVGKTAAKVIEYYKKKDFLLITLFMPDMIHVINDVNYLHYTIHKSDFHLPVHVYELYGFDCPANLKMKNIKNFSTFGEDINQLLSIKFCDSIIDLIRSKNYHLIDGNLVKKSKKYRTKS